MAKSIEGAFAEVAPLLAKAVAPLLHLDPGLERGGLLFFALTGAESQDAAT